jgi:thiol-disulfide isomerase/thioredoxin
MLTPTTLKAAFNAALPYEAYLATGTPDQQDRWSEFERMARAHAGLNTAQRSLTSDFTRKINILVLSGMWCGDCAHQCPLLAIIADHAATIDLRFIDRDQAKAISDAVKIAGGNRVPTAIFMNEDFEFVAIFGDKSLSRLRAQAAKALGASCPLPGADVPHDEIAATLADWLAEIERVHLLLRLSPKLRQRYED